MTENSNDALRTLVEAWCDRRDYSPLAIVLPAWIANSGLTDGWKDLHDSLKHAYAMCTQLPAAERDILKNIYVDIDYALRNRT